MNYFASGSNTEGESPGLQVPLAKPSTQGQLHTVRLECLSTAWIPSSGFCFVRGRCSSWCARHSSSSHIFTPTDLFSATGQK